MHAEAIPATTHELPRLDFPLNHHNPLEFVEFTTLMLSQVETPHDIAYATVAFLREEVVDYIDLHSNELNIVATLWTETAKRVISSLPVTDFPYELLMLPLFFRRWHWRQEMPAAWREFYENVDYRMNRLPPNTEYYVTFGIVLFFVDAVFNDDNVPFEKLTTRFTEKLPHPNYTDALLAVGMILGRNGWDASFQ